MPQVIYWDTIEGTLTPEKQLIYVPDLTSSHLSSNAGIDAKMTSGLKLTDQSGQFNREISIDFLDFLDKETDLPFSELTTIPPVVEYSVVDSQVYPVSADISASTTIIDINPSLSLFDSSCDITSSFLPADDFVECSKDIDIMTDSTVFKDNIDDWFNADPDITSTTNLSVNCDLDNAPYQIGDCTDLSMGYPSIDDCSPTVYPDMLTDQCPSFVDPQDTGFSFLDDLEKPHVTALPQCKIEPLALPIPKPSSNLKRKAPHLKLNIDQCHATRPTPPKRIAPMPSHPISLKPVVQQNQPWEMADFDDLLAYLLPSNESVDNTVTTTTPPCGDLLDDLFNNSSSSKNDHVQHSRGLDSEAERRLRNNEASKRSRAAKRNRYKSMEQEIEVLESENSQMAVILDELNRARVIAKRILVSRLGERKQMN